jgi:small GTP-binding protein
MDEDCEMFKIVIIGSMGTGKTNISMRYVKSEYIEDLKPTVGVEFLSKIAQVRNQRIKVTLWDTAGQERYKSLSKVYYKGASGILIVYDVTDVQSYLDLEAWIRLASKPLSHID